MGEIFRTFAAFIIVMVTFVDADSDLEFPGKINEDLVFTIDQQEIDADLVKVFGAQQCGGEDIFIELKYADCTSPSATCEVHGDNVARAAQLTFSAGNGILELGARLKISAGGFQEWTIYDKVVENSAVLEGEVYRLNAMIAASPFFVGKTITLKFELYDTSNIDFVTLCVFTNFNIIQ